MCAGSYGLDMHRSNISAKVKVCKAESFRKLKFHHLYSDMTFHFRSVLDGRYVHRKTSSMLLPLLDEQLTLSPTETIALHSQDISWDAVFDSFCGLTISLVVRLSQIEAGPHSRVCCIHASTFTCTKRLHKYLAGWPMIALTCSCSCTPR